MADRIVAVRLQAEIGQYVSGMTRAAVATKGLGETAETSSRKAKSSFDIAGRGALLFGGAVAGALVGIVAKSTEFEKAMSAASAATQQTGASLLALREAAMRAGADTQYSATEAAQAITEMGKAGVSTTDILNGGLEGALALAAAGQLDVAQAAEIASVAMTQFGLSGEQLPHVADLLAAGAGKAMGSVEDLGAALNQAGLIANAAGLGIEETTGALAAFASAGLIGSDAGTSFKTMLQALQAPSGKAAELMAELGLNMYDAEGNMLGLDAIAGQLQTQLSGLTEEQRNSALATIFGSDAVRAANVLYNEGAAGIADWTRQVNDQGYAAEQAAALTDNLAGDLERLGGAFDTLLISLGEGAQGPLREVVQGLTALVDLGVDLVGFLSDNAELAAALAVALGVHLVGGITAVNVAFNRMVLTPAVLGMSGLLGTVLDLPGALRSASGAAAGFIAAAAPLAAAGGVVYALTEFIGNMNAAEAQIDSAAEAGREFGGTLADQGGVINSVTLEAALLAAESAGLSQAFERADISSRTLTEALAGNEAAYRKALSAAEDMDAQTSFLGNSWGLLGVQMDVVSGRATENADAFRALAGELEGVGEVTVVSTGAWGRAVAVAEAMQPAVTDAGNAVGSFGAAMETTRKEVDEATQAVDDFKLSLDILTGATVSMIQVESAFHAAVAEANGALEGMNGTVLDGAGNLNTQSESGRAASAVLLDVRDSGNQLIATMIEQGDTAEEVMAADRNLRESFIRSAQQMGISRAAAEKLADQILGIPSERETKIEADTRQAASAIAGVQGQLNGLQDKTVTIRTVYTESGNSGAISGQRRPGLAFGGTVPGSSPHDRADDVPIMATAGEFMQPRPAVRKYGTSFMEAVRTGRFPTELARGYADGGPIITIGMDRTGINSAAASLAAAKDVTKYVEVASSGTAGSGSVSGAWGSLWDYVRARVPAARINSTYRAGDPGYHGRGKAIDFGYGTGPGGAGSAGLALINRVLHDGVGANLAELIYDGIGDDRPDLKNGRPLTYSAATRAAHTNHVHAAVYDQGGPLYPGLTLAYNGTGKTEWVSKEMGGGGGGPGGAVSVAAPQVVVQFYVDGQEFRGMTRTEINAAIGSVNSRLNASGVRG